MRILDIILPEQVRLSQHCFVNNHKSYTNHTQCLQELETNSLTWM